MFTAHSNVCICDPGLEAQLCQLASWSLMSDINDTMHQSVRVELIILHALSPFIVQCLDVITQWLLVLTAIMNGCFVCASVTACTRSALLVIAKDNWQRHCSQLRSACNRLTGGTCISRT